MNVEADERRRYILVTASTGFGQVVGVHGRFGVGSGPVLMRRMAIRADRAGIEAQFIGLAVEGIPECRQKFAVASATVVRPGKSRFSNFRVYVFV